MRIPTLQQIKTMLTGSKGPGERTELMEEEGPCSSSDEHIHNETFCESTTFGTILVTFSAVCYGLCASAVSMGGDIAAPVVVGARYLGSFIFISIACVLGRVNVLDLDRASITKVLVPTCIFGYAAFACVTFAFQNMPVGEATVLVSMAPVFVALLSICCLGEKLSCMGWFLTILSLIGVVLVVEPWSQNGSGSFPKIIEYVAACAAIGQALSKSLWYIFTKRSHNRIYFLTMIFWYAVFGTILSISFVVVVYFPLKAAGKDASWVFSKLDGKDVLLLTVISILAFLAQLTVTKATQMMNTTIASLISNTDIIVTLLFQIFYSHIIPSWVQIIGMVVMVTATFSLLLMKEHQKRKLRSLQTLGEH